MGKFEEKFIYPLLKTYANCTSVILTTYSLAEPELKKKFCPFLTTLKNRNHTIKFDQEISPNKVNTVDTSLYVDENGTLQTKLYKKAYRQA